MPLLEVRGLVKWYGPRKVVDGVSFDVNPGEVVGLLGSNGAGKTTSFRMTTGQVTPNDGKVLFADNDVTTLPMYRRARLGMGYLSQEQSIFRKLTVEQNLLAILEALPRSRTLGRKLTRSERWDRTEEALNRFNLLAVRKNNAARCSGGEKRRLEIARCLVCEPLLILLDEPFAAVDPKTTEDIRHNIRDLAATGIGILLTDHNVREVLKITDRSYLIQAGRVVTAGTPQELIHDPIAIREYLGNTFTEDAFGRPLANSIYSTNPPLSANKANTESEPIIPLSNAPPTVNWNGRQSPILSPRDMIEIEKMRQYVEQLRDRQQMPQAWQQLSQRGRSAIPVLMETLERQEVELRHIALRLLESIVGVELPYQADASEDQRRRQLVQLKAQLLTD